MPNPFPGMNPYLEDRSFWPDVHSSLMAYMREALQPQVLPKYIARIGERVELTDLRKGYVPDVLIIEPPRNRFATIQGATGLLTADVPQTFAFLEEERHIPYIELVYRTTGDVITVIEVLSPANKSGIGHQQYLRKQDDLLATQVNLVEIDLLHGGEPTTLARTVSITAPMGWCYVVSVNRPLPRTQLEVYAFGLKERLPRCRIPLRPADGDVVLDLPAVFERCYAVGGYDLLIDYTQPPPVALSEDEKIWLHEHLQDRFVRPGSV